MSNQSPSFLPHAAHQRNSVQSTSHRHLRSSSVTQRGPHEIQDQNHRTLSSAIGRKRSRAEAYEVNHEALLREGQSSWYVNKLPSPSFQLLPEQVGPNRIFDIANHKRRQARETSSEDLAAHDQFTSLGEGNDMVRSQNIVIASDGAQWSQYMFGLVGGLASRVLDFCWTSAFQGFKAGGGMVTQLTGASPKNVEPSLHTQDVVNITPITPHGYDHPRNYLESSPSSDLTDLRPAKRLQTNHDGGWVVINPTEQALSQRPRTSSTASPRSLIPRPSTNRPSATHRARPATLPSSPLSQKSSSPSKAARIASFASIRSPAQLSPSHNSLAPESPTRIPQRQPTESSDWDADASMRRLNQQLKAMINEGKAALAASPEVEGQQL